jgi:hypothetical protein
MGTEIILITNVMCKKPDSAATRLSPSLPPSAACVAGRVSWSPLQQPRLEPHPTSRSFNNAPVPAWGQLSGRLIPQTQPGTSSSRL